VTIGLLTALARLGFYIACGQMRPRNRVLQRRGRTLLRLLSKWLPKEYEVIGGGDSWPDLGVGLLCRMATTLESILTLQPAERETDATTLTRSLYEHAVHFVWLAAEPSDERIRRWRRDDLAATHTVDNEMSTYRRPLLTPAGRADLERELDALSDVEPLPSLEAMAKAADRYWEQRIPGLDSRKHLNSFGGLYASLYRHYSGVAHPSGTGIQRVYESLGQNRRRYRLEQPYDERRIGPYGMATVVFAWALYAAAQTLGWPPASEVDAVFDSER
jgi:hypothetical protein